MTILDKIRTQIGKYQGYSSCSHCGRTWNVVKPRSIKYSKTGGMFPVCKKCFDKLPPERIDGYIDQLVLLWISQYDQSGYKWDKESPEEITRNAKAEMRRMKGGAK